MIQKLAIEIITALFVVLFVYAATSKIIDFEKFSNQVGQSPLITAYAKVIPFSVIAVELFIAVLLITPRLRLLGFYCSLSLMTMFTAYIFAILNFSSYIPCSCGGVLEKLSWTEHLVFNMAFMVLSVVGILFMSSRKQFVTVK